MEKTKSIMKVVSIVSLLGCFLAFGLLEYHRSFDPYGWLDTGIESVESKNLWNEKKWQYYYFGAISFIPLFLSSLCLFFIWTSNRRKQVNFK